MDQRALDKIKRLDTKRLETLLYGLLKAWDTDKSQESFDEHRRAEAMMEALCSKEPGAWSRFRNFLDYIDDPVKLQTLLVFLERRQGLLLKDSDFMGSSKEKDFIESSNEKDYLSSKNTEQNKIPLYLVLSDLRSAFNIGSAFRLAECMGVKKIFLCGYTASPENAKISKSAMGSESLVDWEYVSDDDKLVEILKQQNIINIGLENAHGAKNLKDWHAQAGKSYALWLGNERFGLDENFLEKLDQIVSIPMFGKKNSLNVISAASMAIFKMNTSIREL